jgi:hypothetical protein
MSILSAAIYTRLANDAILSEMLTTYASAPAIFTTRPVPGDATPPYLVTAGDVADAANDSKNSLGRETRRDVSIFAPANGSAALIEQIAERVRVVLHRQALSIAGYRWLISECSGPVANDGDGYYGRVVTVRVVTERIEETS